MRNKKINLISLLILIRVAEQQIVREIREEDLPKLIEMTKNSPVKIVITFYSETCPHCQAFHPLLDQLADEFYKDSKLIAFFKMDVFKNSGITSKVQISSLPDIKGYGKGELIGSAQPGFSDSPPLIKSWLLNIEKGISSVIGFARIDQADFDRREIEFKMKLKKDYLPKIVNQRVFAQVLFKEVYDSRQHNWYKDDEDLIQAFFY